MSSKYTEQDVFQKWKAIMESHDGAQFLGGNNRKENLSKLFMMLIAKEIAYNEAKSLEKDVVKVLTTPFAKGGGKRPSGAYRDWCKNVEDDFKMLLADEYLNDEEVDLKNSVSVEKDEPVIKVNRIDDDENILDWCANKFGLNCPTDFIDGAHTINHAINIWYLQDTLK